MMRATAAILAAFTLQVGTAPERPQVFGISHVAIQVTDLAPAREFYGGLLGFPEHGPKRPHVAVFVVNMLPAILFRPDEINTISGPATSGSRGPRLSPSRPAQRENTNITSTNGSIAVDACTTE